MMANETIEKMKKVQKKQRQRLWKIGKELNITEGKEVNYNE